MQDGAGNGSQHSLAPPGFAVAAEDDEGGVVFLGYLIQGAARQPDGGFEDDVEALGRQNRPLDREAGGGRGRLLSPGPPKKFGVIT